MGWGGMDCIDLAEYRDQWRVMNTAKNLRVAERLAPSQGLESMELVS
jgi:hypothetical protein